MVLPLLAIVVIVLIVLYFIFKLIKSIIRTALIALCTLAVIFLVGAFLVANDVKEMQGTYNNASKIFLAVKGETAFAGFAQNKTFGQNISFNLLSASELSLWSAEIKNGTLNSRSSLMLRLFVVNESVLAADPEKLIFIDNNSSLSRRKLFESLIADSTTEVLASHLGISKEIMVIVYSENDLKARVFGYLAQDTL
ncbi:MAG: hypothetical protein AABX51_08490, partial [Nanoarchaeota archaeon]